MAGSTQGIAFVSNDSSTVETVAPTPHSLVKLGGLIGLFTFGIVPLSGPVELPVELPAEEHPIRAAAINNINAVFANLFTNFSLPVVTLYIVFPRLSC